MTDTEIDTDTTPYGPRDHWTRLYGEGRQWYRHTWTVADLAGHLADALPGGAYATGSPASIEDANGDTVAYLVTTDEMTALRNGQNEIEKLKEAPRDTAMHPAVNGPYAGGDGLLIDTEGIERELAWVYARREVGEPPKGDDRTPESLSEWRDRVKIVADRIEKDDEWGLLGSAVSIALTTKLPADERGVVPVRMWCKRDDGAETAAQWTLAYTTPARGLFVRGGNPSLFGESYTVVTGSGYAIRAGFINRETAADFAVAIAEAVPGIDWRIWATPWDETPRAILEALSAVAKNWSQFGRNDTPETTNA